jgi:hypothetical protein
MDSSMNKSNSKTFSRLENLKDLVTQMGHDDAQYERWHAEIKQLESKPTIKVKEFVPKVRKIEPIYNVSVDDLRKGDYVFVANLKSKMRSNKMLTQRAIDEVINYVRRPTPTKMIFNNTTVEVDEDLNLTVLIFNNPILHITMSGDGKDFDKVYVYSGGHYDNDGNPSDTTRERLNGLLDALGWCGVIPRGVRVFFDPEYAVCYFGSGEQKVALNKNYNTIASIEANPDQFIFDDEMI